MALPDTMSTISNLFSDLGPLIALFGEQVSKQFLAQSLGVADSFLYAMAPLGIITGTVSAIRMKGSGWLRSVIGRSSESKTIAALELTSATSTDICELWDGQSVVRVQGSPTFLAVVYKHEATPSTGGQLSEEDAALTSAEDARLLDSQHEGNSLSILSMEEAKQAVLLRPKKSFATDGASRMEGQTLLGDEVEESWMLERIPPPPSRMPSVPPNLTLNMSGRPSNITRRIAAVGAVLLQLSVLGISLSQSKFTAVKLPRYVLPLYFLGTISINLGMFICAELVRHGADKELWSMAGSSVNLLWIQKSQRIGDKHFPSYAIPCSQRQLLIMSTRPSQTKLRSHLVLVASFCSLAGFISQFLALRNSHWSIAVSQLVAMAVITLLRVSTRMPLSRKTSTTELTSDFELEWATKHLVPYTTLQIFFDSSNDSAAAHLNLELTADPVWDARIKLGRISRNAGWSSSYSGLLQMLTGCINGLANTVWGLLDHDSEFKEARRLNLPVYVCYNRGSGDGTVQAEDQNSKQWALKLRRHRFGATWGPWMLDELDLEALFGLWVCELVHKYRPILGKDKSHRIPFIWAVALATPSSCLDLDWWVHRGVSYFKIQVAHDVPFFKHEGKLGMCSPNVLQRMSHASVDREITTPVFAVMTYASLPEMAARYILAGFLGSMIHHAEGTYGASTVVHHSSRSLHEVHLTNPDIHQLVDNCGPNKLMSQSEAYNVVVPILRSMKLIPDAVKDIEMATSKFLESKAPLPDQENRKLALAYNFMRSIYASQFSRSVDYADRAKELFASESETAQSKKWKFHDELIEWAIMKSTAPAEESERNDTHHSTNTETSHSRLSSSTGNWLRCLEQKLASRTYKSLGMLREPFNLTSAVSRHSLVGVAMILLQPIGTGESDRLNPGLLDAMNAAVVEDQLEILQLLLWHMKPAWNSSVCSTYPLVSAIKKSNTGAFNLLIKSGMIVDAAGSDGSTALEAACEAGSRDCVSKLLQAGAKMDYPLAGNHPSPLAAAIANGDEEICELLSGHDLKQAQRLYGSPGSVAAKHGRLKILKKLIDQGVSVEQRPMRGGRTLLQAAAEHGRVECVKYLLEIGANQNAYPAPEGGLTALQAAARNGHEACIMRLLDAGADVNAFPAATGGLTVLQAAAQCGDEKLLRLFLSQGAYVHAPATKKGLTAIQAAAGEGHLVAFDLLLEQGADPFAPATQDFGRTCLQIASEHGHLHIVERIFAIAGAYSNDCIPRVGGRTALQASAENCHREVFEYLISHEVGDLNAPPSQSHGMTALQAAAKTGNLEFCQRLLELGALVNAPCSDVYGLTAVQAASSSGNQELVKYLYENGADLHAPAAVTGGRTALQAAAEGGHTQLVRYLLENGVYFNERPAMENAFRVRDRISKTEVDDLGLTVPPWAWVKSKEEEIGSFDFDKLGFAADKPVDEAEIMRILDDKASAEEQLEEDNSEERDEAQPTQPSRTWWLFHRTSAPLYIAASTGHEHIVRHVLDSAHGESVDLYQQDSQSGRTALENASANGHDAVVLRLICYEDGLADPPANTERARIIRTKALNLAAASGHAPVVALLVSAGADVNAAAEPIAGRTALQAAVENNHFHVVKLLLEAGADIDSPAAEILGKTVREACENCGDRRIREILGIEE